MKQWVDWKHHLIGSSQYFSNSITLTTSAREQILAWLGCIFHVKLTLKWLNYKNFLHFQSGFKASKQQRNKVCLIFNSKGKNWQKTTSYEETWRRNHSVLLRYGRLTATYPIFLHPFLSQCRNNAGSMSSTSTFCFFPLVTIPNYLIFVKVTSLFLNN